MKNPAVHPAGVGIASLKSLQLLKKIGYHSPFRCPYSWSNREESEEGKNSDSVHFLEKDRFLDYVLT